jgi:hypothetical protein
MFVDTFSIDEKYANQGPIETFVSAILYKKADMYKKQLDVLKYAEENGFMSHFNLLNLWYGNVLLNNNIDESYSYLNRFLTNQKKSSYVLYTQFKLSLYWFVKDNKQKSDSLNNVILKASNSNIEEDKQAIYEVNNAINWQKELILARLLFDGGNYIQVLQLLKDVDTVKYNKEQMLEYNYRMGRVYDKMKNIENASVFYEKVIYSGLDEYFYYPAYASYYLGKMYLNKNDKNTANVFFNKCLSLDSPIYKWSVHRKAQQSISN